MRKLYETFRSKYSDAPIQEAEIPFALFPAPFTSGLAMLASAAARREEWMLLRQNPGLIHDKPNSQRCRERLDLCLVFRRPARRRNPTFYGNRLPGAAKKREGICVLRKVRFCMTIRSRSAETAWPGRGSA